MVRCRSSHILTLASLLVVAGFLTPVCALAQAPPEPPPVPDHQEVDRPAEEPNRLTTDDTSDVADTEPTWDVSPPQRVFLEVVGGIAGFFAVGTVGAVIGALYAAPSAASAGFLAPAVLAAGAITGGAAGAIAGVPSGIHLVGQKTRHQGNLTVLCVATGLGLAAASGMTYLAAQNNPNSARYVGAASFVVLPVAFGVGSYEVTANMRDKNRPEQRRGMLFDVGFGPQRNGKGALISIGARW